MKETTEKITTFANREKLEIHLIGRLQKNKVRKAIQLYDVIQTVDATLLAERINKIAKEEKKTQRIYLQVNSGKDRNKQGFNPNKLVQEAIQINTFSNIIIEGIMMIPPLISRDNNYRTIFKKTRILRDKIIGCGIKSCKHLSMGMTRDFELAIEEGATHVRIGTGLFGERPQ